MGKQEKVSRDHDTTGEERALHKLEELISAQHEGTPAWEEADLKLLDQLLKLVESERKRVVEAQQVISVEEVLALIAALADTNNRHV